jgi:hypothetical protein
MIMATYYYYLVESARVDGKPRIVSQEYLATAHELAAAMRGGQVMMLLSPIS